MVCKVCKIKQLIIARIFAVPFWERHDQRFVGGHLGWVCEFLPFSVMRDNDYCADILVMYRWCL